MLVTPLLKPAPMKATHCPLMIERRRRESMVKSVPKLSFSSFTVSVSAGGEGATASVAVAAASLRAISERKVSETADYNSSGFELKKRALQLT